MSARTKLTGLAMAVAVAFAPVSIAWAEQAAPTAEDKAGWFHEEHVVDYDFIAPFAVLPQRDDVLIVDSRPDRMFGPGHIPTSVLIPDSKFAEMTDMLPEAKDQMLIFYCGGYACKLSHKSAFKAEEMGYTNVKVYAAGFPDWKEKGGSVSINTAYLQQLMAGEEPVLVVDSRPKGSKYDKGYIPGAISLPDTKFDTMSGLLPTAKDTALVFYCGGFICKLSDNSAQAAMEMGYTKVFTYPAGYPEWKKLVGVVAMLVSPDTNATAAMTAPDMPAPGEGAMGVEEFNKILAERPDNVLIVDVRDVEEFAAGALQDTMNVPVGELEDKVFDLPDDKKIIFICTSGGRSGEAYDLSKLLNPGLDVAFLDAVVKYKKDGTIEVTPHS
ncbi:rhodanese-like domain-containing protein [Tropicimonas sp. TH_r6]|uniref:rhodanese-like domain-containing protein n=1 Tax=Tropicimonas sp. TH_r6 TaxID=3082085 RepID=UPI002955C553|nr:rhodanese-like domain-containing protein [Tropicimonas sp. TH_r6]MDV7145414.1 rhodanese-like domain-containing protein [Tropicimonas sp. TH_r6]